MTRTNSLAMIVLVASAMLTGCGGDAKGSSGTLAPGYGRLRLAVMGTLKGGEIDLPSGLYDVILAANVSNGIGTADVAIARQDGPEVAHTSFTFDATQLGLADGSWAYKRFPEKIDAGVTNDESIAVDWNGANIGGVNWHFNNLFSPAFQAFTMFPGPNVNQGDNVMFELQSTNPNHGAPGDLAVQVQLFGMPLGGSPLQGTPLSFAGLGAGSSVPVESYRGTMTINVPNGNFALAVTATDHSGRTTKWSKPVNVGGNIAPQPPYQVTAILAPSSDSTKTSVIVTLSGPGGPVSAARVNVWDPRSFPGQEGDMALGHTDANGRCILDLNNGPDGKPLQTANWSVVLDPTDGGQYMNGTVKPSP